MPVVYATIPALGAPMGLYSHVARADRFTFFAGMAAIGSAGEIVGRGDFAAQLRAAYSQLTTALTAEGLAATDIVQLTTYLVREGDVDEFYRVRAEIYDELFADTGYPPHVLLVVQRLADPEMLVEIQAVAYR